MTNLFDLLKKHEQTITEGFENKHYWETQNDVEFNRNIIGPDGNYYDEAEIYEQMKQSDKMRLIKFG